MNARWQRHRAAEPIRHPCGPGGLAVSRLMQFPRVFVAHGGVDVVVPEYQLGDVRRHPVEDGVGVKTPPEVVGPERERLAVGAVIPDAASTPGDWPGGRERLGGLNAYRYRAARSARAGGLLLVVLVSSGVTGCQRLSCAGPRMRRQVRPFRCRIRHRVLIPGDRRWLPPPMPVVRRWLGRTPALVARHGSVRRGSCRPAPWL
jgi:hypothetical protein